MTTGWDRDRYALFRISFGLYLLVHFAQLLPWSAELFSDGGMLPDAALSPLIRAFPNVLGVVDSPAFVELFVLGGALLCLPFILGWKDRLAAVGIWFVWACLFGRNPLIANPGLPYVGLLLLVHACLDPRRPGWRMPASIHRAVWIVMAVGYSYSGLTKLVSPSWIDGTAVAHILANPLARPTALRAWLLDQPALLTVASYGALALEILYAPLALSRRARPWIWAAMLAMHLALVVLIDFADLTMGMVALHAFTFEPAWVERFLTRISSSDRWAGSRRRAPACAAARRAPTRSPRRRRPPRAPCSASRSSRRPRRSGGTSRRTRSPRSRG